MQLQLSKLIIINVFQPLHKEEYGVIELVFWSLRAFFSIFGVVCVCSLYLTWRDEELILGRLHDLTLVRHKMISETLRVSCVNANGFWLRSYLNHRQVSRLYQWEPGVEWVEEWCTPARCIDLVASVWREWDRVEPLRDPRVTWPITTLATLTHLQEEMVISKQIHLCPGNYSSSNGLSRLGGGGSSAGLRSLLKGDDSTRLLTNNQDYDSTKKCSIQITVEDFDLSSHRIVSLESQQSDSCTTYSPSVLLRHNSAYQTFRCFWWWKCIRFCFVCSSFAS